MKKTLTISTLALLFAFAPNVSALAQDDKIPSDLALDLVQAEQNQHPQRKQIVTAQKLKVELTTQEGKVTVQPETKLTPEIETQRADQVEHPEQTTSEQVQQTPVTGTHSPPEAPNLVPGTSIVEPDDNAAPPPPTSESITVTPIEIPSSETPATEIPTPAVEGQFTSRPEWLVRFLHLFTK